MRLSLIAVVATVGVFAAGCGGGEKKSEESELSAGRLYGDAFDRCA